MRVEPGTGVPDLTGLPLDELLDSSDSVLAKALRRVLEQTTGTEPPISAYQSGTQFPLSEPPAPSGPAGSGSAGSGPAGSGPAGSGSAAVADADR